MNKQPPASSLPPLRVLIVGAGLAGLSTAISLTLATSSAGRPPVITILESLPHAAGPIGAGLQLTPNATRLLARWGVLPQIEAVCAEPRRLVVHRYADGKALACDERFSQRIRGRYEGFPFVDVHRGDLMAEMLGRAQGLGVRVEWGERVKGVEFGDVDGGDAPVRVVTEAGGVYEGDVVVGADGIWSKCREVLLGKADPPLPTGDLAYRIVLTLEDLGNDEELVNWVRNPECHFWVGPNSHAVGYSVRKGNMYNLVLLCPDDLPADVARQQGEVSEMKKLFEGWDPILTRFLSKVKKVDKWKLMHRPEMERWVGKNGRLVLEGDSSHSSLPYLAQGANSSLEDGAVLGWCLAKADEKGERKLKEAVELFEKVRKERAEKVAKETFLQRHQFHMPDGPEQEERDRIFSSQLGKDEIDDSIPFPSRWTCGIVQRWLYGYDAYAAVEKAYAENPF